MTCVSQELDNWSPRLDAELRLHEEDFNADALQGSKSKSMSGDGRFRLVTNDHPLSLSSTHYNIYSLDLSWKWTGNIEVIGLFKLLTIETGTTV